MSLGIKREQRAKRRGGRRRPAKLGLIIEARKAINSTAKATTSANGRLEMASSAIKTKRTECFPMTIVIEYPVHLVQVINVLSFPLLPPFSLVFYACQTKYKTKYLLDKTVNLVGGGCGEGVADNLLFCFPVLFPSFKQDEHDKQTIKFGAKKVRR